LNVNTGLIYPMFIKKCVNIIEEKKSVKTYCWNQLLLNKIIVLD